MVIKVTGTLYNLNKSSGEATIVVRTGSSGEVRTEIVERSVSVDLLWESLSPSDDSVQIEKTVPTLHVDTVWIDDIVVDPVEVITPLVSVTSRWVMGGLFDNVEQLSIGSVVSTRWENVEQLFPDLSDPLSVGAMLGSVRWEVEE